MWAVFLGKGKLWKGMVGGGLGGLREGREASEQGCELGLTKHVLHPPSHFLLLEFFNLLDYRIIVCMLLN